MALRSGLRNVRIVFPSRPPRSSAEGSLRLGWLALLKWCEQIDRDWKKRCRIVLAGNLTHGLQKAQLQRNRLLAHHRGGLHHFFGGLKFALGVDDLGTAFALGFC